MRSFIWLTILLFILVACTSPVTQPTSTGEITPPIASAATQLSSPLPKPDCPFETLYPGTVIKEILRTSGSGTYTSEPFKLNEKTSLRLHWVQSSQSEFLMAITNLDSAMENTSYGKVNFALSVGPSASCGDYEFIPGDYQVLIEKADGPWEIWIEIVRYNK